MALACFASLDVARAQGSQTPPADFGGPDSVPKTIEEDEADKRPIFEPGFLDEYHEFKKRRICRAAGQSRFKEIRMRTSKLATLILMLAGMLIGQAALAEDVVKVTADNYVRAETDYQVKTYVEGLRCFGKLVHGRKPYALILPEPRLRPQVNVR